MAESNVANNGIYGQCKCCLKTTYLKNMWQPELNNGKWEVYGQMLVDCFGIDWAVLTLEDDNICAVCISKLRVAMAFKHQLQESQAITLAQIDELSTNGKTEFPNRVQVNTILTLDRKEVNFVPTAPVNNLKPHKTQQVFSTTPTQINIKSHLKKEDTTSLEKNCTIEENVPTLRNDNQVQKNNSINNPIKNIKIVPTTIKKENRTVAVEEDNVATVKNDNSLQKVNLVKTPFKKVKIIPTTMKKEDTVDVRGDYFIVTQDNTHMSELIEHVGSESSVDKNQEEEEEVELRDMKAEEEIFEEMEFLEELDSDRDLDDDDENLATQPKRRKTSESRVIKRRSKRKVYSVDDMRRAVDAVTCGKMSRREASRVFNVPRSKISEDSVLNFSEDVYMRHMINATKAILTYTNATPFKVSGQGSFRCFYCGTEGPVFGHPGKLRRHTHSIHPDKVKSTDLAVRPRYLNQMVRFDINKLKCCCSKPISWDGLFEHLEIQHGVENIEEARDKVIPYNLISETDIIPCAFANCDYTGCFGSVDTHMNKHYPQHLCEECGKPFITEWRLRCHEQYHQKITFRCKHCPELFPTKETRQLHTDQVHVKTKTFRCRICWKAFSSDAKRLNHLRVEHADVVDKKGRYCNLCGNYFWPRDFEKHMALEHGTEVKSEERKFKCAICSEQFYSKKDVLEHISLDHEGRE